MSSGMDRMSGVTGTPVDDWPLFDELSQFPGTDERNNWGVFGPDDELGTINFIDSATRVSAMSLVTSGQTVDLSLELDQPSPSLSASRPPYRHTVDVTRAGRNDSLDSFHLQGSTQWDGLQHVRYREFGYYGGRQEPDLDVGALGIDRLAHNGIIGRGVLLDVSGYFESNGVDIKPDTRYPISVSEFDAVLQWQDCEVRQGDILLVRTGWMKWYLDLPAHSKEQIAGTLGGADNRLACIGLDPSQETARWLWNRRIAAVLTDNPAVESLPVRRDEGFLHRRLIPLLGMPLGEFWNLEDLSVMCRESGRYEFAFVSAPLKLARGVASPGNGYAIF